LLAVNTFHTYMMLFCKYDFLSIGTFLTCPSRLIQEDLCVCVCVVEHWRELDAAGFTGVYMSL